MTFFSTSERLEIGNVPFISHGPKPSRAEALEYYRRVKNKFDLNINLYERVLNIKGSNGDFEISTDKHAYRSKKIIIAIGFFDHPNPLDVPGEQLEKVRHYYDDVHPYADQRVVVVGGGNSGVDVSLDIFRKGGEVTMVIKKDRLDDNVKYWVKPDIENRIKEGSITALFNSSVTRIKEKEVSVRTPDGVIDIENDFVLAMTGYHPDFAFLNRIGIKLSKEAEMIPEFNEKDLESNVKGIYLAGVVCGGMDTGRWFIENSIEHSGRIIRSIAAEVERVE
jgi:thioredoxin reductase (NADPH)